MTTSTHVARKAAFRQVSLPVDLLAAVNTAAEASGRSAAKELEHAFRIAQVLENVIPAQSLLSIKQGVMPAREMLEAMLAYLGSPAAQTALARVVAANPSRIARDPNNPSQRIRINADGTKEVGVLDDEGGFTPLTNPSQKGEKHANSENPRAKSAHKVPGKSAGTSSSKAARAVAYS